jgi:hypothetical protein
MVPRAATFHWASNVQAVSTALVDTLRVDPAVALHHSARLAERVIELGRHSLHAHPADAHASLTFARKRPLLTLI